jgi:glycosyltransferase involved in cell wall biosynthesis
MLRLAEGFKRRGYKVLVIAATARGENLSWVPPGAELVDLRAGRMTRALLPLTRVLRARRPAAVVSALDEANVVAVAASRLCGVAVPVVLSTQAAQSACEEHARGLRARFILPWLVRRLYKRADAMVAVSRAAAADLTRLLGLPPDRVVAIPNPVVDAHIDRMRDQPISHPWIEQIGDAPLIVAVGRLAPQKDYSLLLRAFAQSRSSVARARLAILGQGELRAELESLARSLNLGDAVLFAGYQENPYSWMRRADVLALSSKFEGLPTVVIEGLACGARIVATNCPTGPEEILEGGKWGSLVAVGDVEAFAGALSAALRMGRWPQPPAEALSPYTEAPIVAAFERILLPLIAASASAQRLP